MLAGPAFRKPRGKGGVFETILTAGFLVEAMVAIAAGLVRGFSGFGAALILAPGFTLVMAPREAVVMTVLLNTGAAAQLLFPALRLTRWRDIGPMGAAAALAIPFGSLLLVGLDGTVIRRAIGAVVLAFSVATLAGWRYRGPRGQPANLLVGVIGGLLTGAAGVGGPPIILYFLSSDRPMAENRAGFICLFVLIQLVAVPVFLWQGLVTWELVWRAALLLPVYLVATHVGARLFTRTSEHLARRLALGCLVVIGLATLIR
jgi:uncharacterized membrane protein YfcA